MKCLRKISLCTILHILWERNVMMPIYFQHIRACVVAKTSSNAFLGLDLSHTVVFLELLSIFKTMTMAHIPSFTFPFMQNHVCLDNFHDFCALKVKCWIFFSQGYLNQAKKRTDMFTEEQITKIFANIEQIYQFHQEILRQLEECFVEGDPCASEIGAVFLNNVSLSRVPSYCIL